MSYGIVCLTCRKYIGTDPKWSCKCEEPVPSLDAETPATEKQLETFRSRPDPFWSKP